MHNIEFFTMT